MLTCFYLALCLTLMQVGGAYLRFLPFARETQRQNAVRLGVRLGQWSLISLCLVMYALSHSSPGALSYKLIIVLGPLPYILIALYHLRKPLRVHLFVIGMQFLWALVLHTVVGLVTKMALLYSPDPAYRLINLLGGVFYADRWQQIWELGREDQILMPLHLCGYLLLFVLLLVWSRRLFINLLPPLLFSEQSRQNLFMFLLPLFIYFAMVLPIADATMLHGFKYQLSRISIPVFFFFMYQALSQFTWEIEAQRAEEHTRKLMSAQLEALKDYEQVLRRKQLAAVELSRSVREWYHQLRQLVEQGEGEAALQLIQDYDHRLESLKIQSFSPWPVINTVLSIYLERARTAGIRSSCKVKLASFLGVDEQEFSILLSNLLENALQALMQEPREERRLEIGIGSRGRAVALEIVNSFSKPLRLGQDGLPCTEFAEHGLGMDSLAAFVRKYNAYVYFTQRDHLVYCNLYWEEQRDQNRHS